MKPAALRKVRGELYNLLKSPRGGDKKTEEALQDQSVKMTL
jgi:hypothetical protein